MDAVKKGGDRQELHEKIRQHSMAAGAVVKVEGGKNDLVDRIAADRRRVVGIVPVVLQEVGTGIVGVEAVFVRRDPKTASMILRNV